METPDSLPSSDPATSEQISGQRRRRSSLDAAKRWFGVGATLVSVWTGFYGFLEYQADKQDRKRVVAEELVASRTQQLAGDYQQAWDSLAQAAKAIDADGILVKVFGGLSTDQQQLRTAQEDLAMEWLRSVAHTQSEIADSTIVVLSAGAAHATGPRKADLLAHIGLAYELKHTELAFKAKQGDVITDLHPERFYREAIAADPTNPYANSFLGYDLVAEDPSPDGIAQAMQHFKAALSSSRATGELRKWVRGQQLDSLTRYTNFPAAAAAWWHAVDEMYKGGEPLDKDVLAATRDAYVGDVGNVEEFQKRLDQALTGAPITDHVQLLNMLVRTAPAGYENLPYLKVSLALALEKAGQAAQSLTVWRAARAAGFGDNTYFNKAADAAIARLSAAAPHGS